MARKVKTTLVDDMTGDTADETVSFSLDRVEYEIDLSANNAGVLRDILSDYANAGRKVGKAAAVSNGRSRRSATPRANREQPAAIRAWAREAGRQVSDRGRISAEVAKAFEDAQRGLATVG
jgi:Lsr2